MSSATAGKLGTPIKSEHAGVSTSQRPVTPAKPLPPPPPPVIPTKWLLPHEQRYLFASIFGLVEIMKIWDILSPYFLSNPEPTWSSTIRLSGPWTALLWLSIELSSLFLVSLLRIPLLSPSLPQLGTLTALLSGWNLLCWMVAEPSAFWWKLNLFGPPALGVEWYLAWLPLLQRLVWKEPDPIVGIHKVRLLPYSTATLNPLSLTYCIPPDSTSPLYIPVIFNNSAPEEVSYYIRSLSSGQSDLRTVAASSLSKGSTPARLEITDGDEDDASDTTPDPLSAVILRDQRREVDFAKLPSIRPSDSFSLIPNDLESTQSMLFLEVDAPSLVSLKNVVDKRGDRFHITPHREAVIIECPNGGHFMDAPEGSGKRNRKVDKPAPAEVRCVGDEEVAHFEVRGVGTLKVGWRKRGSGKEGTEHGVIEGIEDDDIASADPGTTARRDKVSKTHTVPLRINHHVPGTFTYSLTSITDSLHNTYAPSGHSAEKAFQVLSRTSARWDCPAAVSLLKNKTAGLHLQLDGNGPLETPMTIKYSHRATDSTVTEKTQEVTKRWEMIAVDQPGLYSLLEIDGTCTGSVMEPSSCLVQEVPLPTVDMQVTTLHECAMDVGVTASFDFTGTPPFMVEYTEQRKGSRAATRTKRFDSHHGDIVLQPEYEGQYTYSFNSLSDKQYSNIKLEKPPISQTVHPLANVDIVGRAQGPKRVKLFACSGDEIDVEVEAKGNGPLRLNYLRSWGVNSEIVTVDIPSGKSKVVVPVPAEYAAERGASGKLSIALLSITDGNGCERKLPAPSVEVDINREKPTARFSKSERIVITEGETASAGLRLTGTGPWELRYAREGTKKEHKVTIRDPNSAISVSEKGTYRLVAVRDANCPGTLHNDASSFEVEYKPRPGVSLIPSPQVSALSATSWTHQGLCADQEDQVALRFSGEAPFELTYRHTREGHTARSTLKSAQNTGVLHLATEPGKHRYDFTEIKDSNYARTDVSFSLEHEVHGRPSASFIRQNSHPLCLDSSLSGDARLRLLGKAPWTATLSVRKPASSRTEDFAVSIPGPEWTLDLPYVAAEIGRHEVTLTALSDAGGCDWVVHDADRLSTVVEVVESARIVPVNQVEELCIGDRLDFLLQGKAPWTVEYEWLGKKYRESSSDTRFSRVAEKAGTFAIKSVALKDNQCKREIVDLIRTVHPIPSVRIQDGLDHLREGDDPAAFSVSFKGTPPFTFTYSRSEVVNGRSRVVETQTVTDIWSDEYTISSSQPGDYTVTSIADRWCRYPPLKGKGEA